MNAPCKNCPDRTVEPNCHMTCERYLEYQSYRKNLIESHREEQEYWEYRKIISARVGKAYQAMKKCQRYRNRMN